MKSITVRGIDTELSAALGLLSCEKNKSINQLILDCLKKETGLSKGKQFTRRYHDLDELWGAWSQEEFQRVEKAIDEQRGIDQELWS